MQVYVASPLGFSEAGNAFYRDVLIPLLQRLGHHVVDPWTLTDRRKLDAVSAMPYGPERRDEWRRLNAEIARTNHAAIDRCDALVAVLDGVDVDSGTAAEIGYAFARENPSLDIAAMSGFRPTTKAPSSICRSSTSSARAAGASSGALPSWATPSRRSRLRVNRVSGRRYVRASDRGRCGRAA
jgi:nucleoside 2-deoxyribosyltransferase